MKVLTILHWELHTGISLNNELPRHAVNVTFLPYSFQNEKEQACT